MNTTSTSPAPKLDPRTPIENVLWTGGLSIACQPIVELDTRTIVGYEALARFSAIPARPPDQWFAQAAAVGLGEDLELLAVDRALELLPRLGAHTHLAINASPATIMCDAFGARLDALPAIDRIVLEVTEHAPIADYDRFADALTRHRRRGLELAVDDTGAGFASLRHILRLRPDTIKLDRTITDQIDTDRNTRALAAALTSFALETQSSVTAEGIETSSQLSTLQALGINLGQGYFLGRPAPLPAWSEA